MEQILIPRRIQSLPEKVEFVRRNSSNLGIQNDTINDVKGLGPERNFANGNFDNDGVKEERSVNYFSM